LVSSPSSSFIKIFKPSLEVTLDIATYNCPCEKTGEGKHTPTVFSG